MKMKIKKSEFIDEFECFLNEKDAEKLGINNGDRIKIKIGKKYHVFKAQITKKVKEGEIYVSPENYKEIGKEEGDVTIGEYPKSLDYIKKKIEGKELKEEEIQEIVKDIETNALTHIELSSYLTAVTIRGFSLKEVVYLTKAIINSGNTLKLDVSPVVDKHSIGGINGRATMIVVPIVASAGAYIPKTSSRAITSPAGTADSVEVLARVSFSIEEMKEIVENHGGILAWGGALNLAPVDDKIIRVEHPLGLDPEGQVIASVMAKKGSVNAKYLVLDLPVGKEAKIKDVEKAKDLAEKFIYVGKEIGITTKALITDGSSPCGKAFGPALEAMWALKILEGDVFDELAEKSIELSGELLELSGIAKKGKGYEKAKKILEEGKAYKKFKEIIKAQDGKIFRWKDVPLGKYKEEIFAKEEGFVKEISLKEMIKISRMLGAPKDKYAGVLLNVGIHEVVNKGDLLFTIYSSSKEKIEEVKKYIENKKPIGFGKVVIESI